MKLGFDLDEVVVRTMDNVSEIIKEKYSINVSIEDFTSYYFKDVAFTNDEELNAEMSEFLYGVVQTPEFLSTCEPYEEASEVIRRLSRQHSIHYISNRPRGLENVSIGWLRRNNFPYNSVHHLGTPSEKGIMGRHLGLDCFVDDKLVHLVSMDKHKKKWRKGLLLMDKPYNQGTAKVTFKRVHNWQEVTRQLGIQNR